MKLRLITFIVLTSVILAACGGAAADTTEESDSTGNPSSASTPVGTLSQLQLAVGTFKLEETELAVTPEQASELLPLWKAVRSLSNSDTAATEEIKALIDQIQETMTSEQLETITTMEITPEDMTALMEQLGITPGFGDRASDGGGSQSREGFAGRLPEGGIPEGGIPEGGIPEGGILIQPGGGNGPRGGGFGDLNPEQMATMQAMREERGGGAGMFGAQFLIDPLIELLESKVG